MKIHWIQIFFITHLLYNMLENNLSKLMEQNLGFNVTTANEVFVVVLV